MKSWCIKDHSTGYVFKVFLSNEDFQDYLKKNPDIDECVDCIECDDASSIMLE